MAGEHLRIGFGHELLASVCFDRCWSRIFPWVRKIRLGTAEEDSQGKDVVVETTDIGDIPIQGQELEEVPEEALPAVPGHPGPRHQP